LVPVAAGTFLIVPVRLDAARRVPYVPPAADGTIVRAKPWLALPVRGEDRRALVWMALLAEARYSHVPF
jgi:hypothetical protein